MNTGVPPRGEELIDVVVRLPRKAIEETLLLATGLGDNLDGRRLEAAKTLLLARRSRAMVFTGIRFYDPSWDMMLELFVASREHCTIAVSQLCRLSGGSTTTALRHIEHLEALGYIRRGPDPDDRRRLIVDMCPKLGEALERWLDVQITSARLISEPFATRR